MKFLGEEGVCPCSGWEAQGFTLLEMFASLEGSSQPLLIAGWDLPKLPFSRDPPDGFGGQPR